jgi:hypothetical protein
MAPAPVMPSRRTIPADMRRSRSRLVPFCSTALTLAVVVTFGALLVVGTPSGQDMLRRQTMAAIDRTVGQDFALGLGRQTLSRDADGDLAMKWTDVSLTRRGEAQPLARVDSIKVGFSLMPVLSGRMQFRTIEIEGGTIDLSQPAMADRAPSPVAATSPARPVAERFTALMQRIEAQVGAFQRVGIDRVRLSDVSLAMPAEPGRPPVSGVIRTAELTLADRSAMTVKAVIEVDGKTLPIAGSVDFDTEAQRLDGLSLTAGPVDLGVFLPPGSPEDRLDERPFGIDSEATATLTVDSDGGSPRRATLSLGIGPGLVQIGKGFTRVESLKGGLRLVEGEAALSLVDTDIAFDGVSMALDGRASVDGSKPSIDAIDFSLQSRDLLSTVGSKRPVPAMGEIAIAGRADLEAHETTLSRLAIDTGGGSLSGDAVLRTGAPEAMTSLRLKASNLGAAEVKAFWPFSIAVNTRRWVMAHVGDTGRVTDGTIAIDVRHDRMDPAFRPGSHPEPEEMDLAFRLEGVTAATLGELPAVTDGKADIHTSGGDTIIDIESGKVAGFDGVSVTQSSVSFIRAPANAVQDLDGSLEVSLSGPVPELLSIAARPPINALKTVDIKPEDATGQAAATARLAFILGDDVAKDKEFGAWSVAVALKDAGLGVPLEGRRLAGMSGDVKIGPGGASGTLDGRIDGLPASVAFNRPFGSRPEGEKQLSVDLSLTGDDVAKLAPALAKVVSGPIAAHLDRKGDAGLRADVDLTGAAVSLPGIGWRKGKGVAAGLSFDLEPGDASTTALKNLVLQGDGFSASGDVVADGEGLKSAELGKLALNAGDDVALSLDRVSNGYSLRVTGTSFDARPFLQDLKANLGAKAKSSGKSSGQLDVGIAIDTLRGFGGKEIGGFTLNYAGSGDNVAALSISGRTAGGGFAADMSPRGKERAIRLRTPDAGSLAEFSGLYDRMEGGEIALELAGSHKSGYRGTLTARNFTLVDEPRLSSLVGSSPSPESASLSQAVGTDLRTERAFFDYAAAGIAYGDDGLALSNGIIRGPVFGSSFAGTVYNAANRMDIVGSFMPAYGVNRIFGAIPLVGQILGNGNEGGLIGITYRLAGDFATPTLTVNPISAIAPGIFRSIFSYQ